MSGLARHVRFTLRSRHRQPAPACPFGAISGLAQRSKGRSFDHLVGQQLHRVRHLNAEGLRGLHVNDQLELDRPHDGKIGGLLAFENAADEASGLAIGVMGIGAIADESAGHHEMPKFVDRGDRVALSQGNDLVLPIGEE